MLSAKVMTIQSSLSKQMTRTLRRRRNDLRHTPTVVDIKTSKVVKKVTEKDYNNNHKYFANTNFCDSIIISDSTYYVILDGPTFNTAKMLVSKKVNPNQIIILESNDVYYTHKVARNTQGFRIIPGRMEKKTREILDIVGGGFIGGIYFDGMGNANTVNVAISTVEKLASHLVEESVVAVTYSTRSRNGVKAHQVQGMLETGLCKVSPLLKLSNHYGYGGPRGVDSNQSMVYTKFICTTRDVKPEFRAHKIVKTFREDGKKWDEIKWRGLNATNNTYVPHGSVDILESV